MFGIPRRPQRGNHAKPAVASRVGIPSKNPTNNSIEDGVSRLNLCPPLNDSNVFLQPAARQSNPFASPQQFQPPKRPKVNISKSTGKTKPQKGSKVANSPGTFDFSSNEHGKMFSPWHENIEEPIADNYLCNLISSKLDSILTSIDTEEFSGDVNELEIREEGQPRLRGGWGSTSREVSRRADRAISSAVVSTNYFSKVYLYANSTLPPNLPPLQLYFPSYPLLCLAAQYSQRAYTKPTAEERETFVNANWQGGTKAMVIKSVPIDDMNCVVFAIRGSQTFMDWAVNLNSAPVAPTDFLDDPGNMCHSGFLSVARNMVKPVAARLRALLEEDPSRATCSLLMTGHSAGGAVASLLYAHMLSEVAKSELNILTGCFKRIHCLTFGTPPISLLPLTKPSTLRHKKSLFMSIINEGDPVPRADKSYIRSLLNLYASPAPGSSNCIAATALPIPHLKPCRPKPQQRPLPQKAHSAPTAAPSSPLPPVYVWNVPPGTLSNAGRLVVLRDHREAGAEATNDVKAVVTSDEALRGVVFGDPVMHMMKVYAKRVEVLATKAVTARIWG